MGIKTLIKHFLHNDSFPLKNLPTTWGLRPISSSLGFTRLNSEKPPHHMGIKTNTSVNGFTFTTLKNLPTTWGLRHLCTHLIKTQRIL